MKRNLCVCLVVCLLIGSMSIAQAEQEAQQSPKSISARSAILIEQTTGRVLYEKNADEPLPMASITKVMTALLAIESGKLDDIVTVSKNAYGIEGSSIYLSLGEKAKLSDLVQGLMVQSGNDAALAIAEHVGGSITGFIVMMNERASQLGMDHTHFANPNGLPIKEHYTTARDWAHLTAYALQKPFFCEVVSQSKARIPWDGKPYDRVLNNKNKLLTTYEGATGVKTGFTKAAGRCLAFSAVRDGLSLVGVVLNCPNWFDDAATLMDAGFAQFKNVTAMDENETVGSVDVKNGDASEVEGILTVPLRAVMQTEQEYTLTFDLPQTLTAPVRQGQIIGSVCMLVEGSEVASVPIAAKEGVREITLMTEFWRVLRLWR